MTKRNYGLDIARILAMNGIVIIHIVGHGGVLENCADYSLSYFTSQLLYITNYASVNVFALLSGYLCIYKSVSRAKRAIELIFIGLFYCIIILVIFQIFSPGVFDGVNDYLYALFPPLRDSYWYIVNYIPLIILMPYINYLINKFSKKQYFTLCIVMFVIFSAVPAIFHKDFFNFKGGFSFSWLLVCYLFGGYIRKHFDMSRIKYLKTKSLILFIIIVMFLFLGNLMGYYIFNNWLHYLVQYYSPFILIMALCVICFCSSLKIKHGKNTLKFLSNSAFDVYLLHANILIVQNLFVPLFSWIGMSNFFAIPWWCIISSASVYLICSTIALIRDVIFKILHIEKLNNIISNKINKIVYSVLEDS